MVEITLTKFNPFNKLSFQFISFCLTSKCLFINFYLFLKSISLIVKKTFIVSSYIDANRLM